MLRRFADARLRSALAREVDKREHAQDKARRTDGLLRQKTAEASTNYALMQRWKSIAQQAQAQRDEALRTASHHATNAAGFRAQLAAEQARTEETQP